MLISPSNVSLLGLVAGLVPPVDSMVSGIATSLVSRLYVNRPDTVESQKSCRRLPLTATRMCWFSCGSSVVSNPLPKNRFDQRSTSFSFSKVL